MYKVFKLKNGLRFVLIKRTGINSILFSAWIKAGSVFENQNNNGIAHLVEHMLFEGTKNYPTVKKLNKKIDQLGLDISGRADIEYIYLYGSIVPKKLEESLLLIKDMIFKPVLDSQRITEEKNVIVDEIEKSTDEMIPHLFDLAQTERFTKDSEGYNLSIIGTKISLPKIKYEEIRNFYDKHYSPNNLIIGVLGDLDIDKTKNLLEKIFEKLPQKKLLNEFPKSRYSNFRIKNEFKKTERVYLTITFPCYSWQDSVKKRVLLNLLRQILSGQRSSLLYEGLRTEDKLIYDVYSSTIYGDQVGVLSVTTDCSKKKLNKVIKIILDQLKSLKNKKISQNQLKSAKDYLNELSKSAFDEPWEELNWMTEDVERIGKFTNPQEIIKIRNSITITDIQKTAQEIFDFKKMNLVAIGPIKNNQIRDGIKRIK